MDEQPPSTADLLVAWRETTHAAELAERLARLAAEAAAQADENASASEQIARMAERAARAAERAALSARQAAHQAAALAERNRKERLGQADDDAVSARIVESEARDRFHDAESAAHGRQTEATSAEN
jgi:hypothetical protein